MSKAPWQIVTRRADVIRTRKYVAVICKEAWGGNHFSRTGWSVFIPRKDATTEWYGANLKKALATSEDFGARFPRPIPSEFYEPAIEESNVKSREFFARITDEFGFPDFLATLSKSALIFVDWPEEKGDQVRMLATRGRGGGHSAWYSHQNFGKVFHVSIDASDLNVGEVVVQALDACSPNYA